MITYLHLFVFTSSVFRINEKLHNGKQGFALTTKEYPSVHMERYSFMRITGLEPARDAHWYLKPARLPIPPYPPVIKTAETL